MPLDPPRPEFVLTRGLPASGKTTIARGWVDELPEGRVRVNRDDLRATLYGRFSGLSRGQEDAVTAAQRGAVRGLLAAGRSVILDDTNLRLSRVRDWERLAAEVGATFAVRDVPTLVDVCVRRDADRAARGERAVGADVIVGFAARYGLRKRWLAPFVPDPALRVVREYDPDGFDYSADRRATWLVDLDGTLALMDGRGPFEWHRVGEDASNETVVLLTRTLATAGYRIVVVSGRDAVCRAETERWLADRRVGYDRLVMRPEGDARKDAVVKAELFWEQIAPAYRVVGVLDDRDQVVRMWRSLGLTCLQVAPGDF